MNKLIIGEYYNYYETKNSKPYPCKLINIKEKNGEIIYIFEHLTFIASGASVYPEKFKLLKKEERRKKLEKINNINDRF